MDQQQDENTTAMIMQGIADQALTEALGNYASATQMHCQHFCEEKSLKDAQDLANQNVSNLTRESVDALELQCNKTCQRKFFKAYHFQHMLQTQPPEQ